MWKIRETKASGEVQYDEGDEVQIEKPRDSATSAVRGAQAEPSISPSGSPEKKRRGGGNGRVFHFRRKHSLNVVNFTWVCQDEIEFEFTFASDVKDLFPCGRHANCCCRLGCFSSSSQCTFVFQREKNLSPDTCAPGVATQRTDVLALAMRFACSCCLNVEPCRLRL